MPTQNLSLTPVEDSGSEEGDIVHDAKFFQDAATELPASISVS